MDAPKRLKRLLRQADTPAGNLLQHVRWLQRMHNSLREILPEALKNHCQMGNIRGGDLVLITDAPVWSTRLRYLAPTLINHLNQRFGLSLTQVKIKVQPSTGTETGQQPPPVPHRAALSAQTAHHLNRLAENFGDDELGAALRRLAGRHQRSS